MYAWASREYMLDHMTWPEILMYYDRGIGFEEHKARILIGTYAQALNPDHETEHKKVSQDTDNQKPDRAAFHARYGNNIKRG